MAETSKKYYKERIRFLSAIDDTTIIERDVYVLEEEGLPVLHTAKTKRVVYEDKLNIPKERIISREVIDIEMVT